MYKEYEGKIKMIQEQELQLKMKFLLGYNMKIVIQWGGGEENQLLVESGKFTGGEFFQVVMVVVVVVMVVVVVEGGLNE